MTPAQALTALPAALEAAEAALSRDDVPAAAAAVGDGLLALQALGAEAAPRPTPAQLAALQALHGRVLGRAVAAHADLSRALEQAGRSCRAAAAYGRR